MDKISVSSYSVKPVLDFNEITYHMAEVMYIHLLRTKGANPKLAVSLYIFCDGKPSQSWILTKNNVILEQSCTRNFSGAGGLRKL